MTHDEALAAIATLREHFDNRMNLSPATVSAWANAITEYPAQTAQPAITNLANTLTRPPYLADLREALAAEHTRNTSRGGHTHNDDLNRITRLLADPNIDPEFRHTLQQEHADVQRDIREAAQELQRDRDARDSEHNPTAHLTHRQ